MPPNRPVGYAVGLYARFANSMRQDRARQCCRQKALDAFRVMATVAGFSVPRSSDRAIRPRSPRTRSLAVAREIKAACCRPRPSTRNSGLRPRVRLTASRKRFPPDRVGAGVPVAGCSSFSGLEHDRGTRSQRIRTTSRRQSCRRWGQQHCRVDYDSGSPLPFNSSARSRFVEQGCRQHEALTFLRARIE